MSKKINKKLKKLTKNQTAVYVTLRDYGPFPDHVLVPVLQHSGTNHQSSSGIRSRRAELAEVGLVTTAKSVIMPSGRKAAVWKATK